MAGVDYCKDRERAAVNRKGRKSADTVEWNKRARLARLTRSARFKWKRTVMHGQGRMERVREASAFVKCTNNVAQVKCASNTFHPTCCYIFDSFSFATKRGGNIEVEIKLRRDQIELGNGDY